MNKNIQLNLECLYKYIRAVLNLMVGLLDQFIKYRNASDYMCHKHLTLSPRYVFSKQNLFMILTNT